jgi:hypothetical protein
MSKRWLETPEEVQQAQKVVSMLEAKVKRGIATPAELERYRAGRDHLVIYDWGTDSYQQNALPKPPRKEPEQPVVARRSLPAPAEPAPAPAKRPPLTKRAG